MHCRRSCAGLSLKLPSQLLGRQGSFADPVQLCKPCPILPTLLKDTEHGCMHVAQVLGVSYW